MVETKRWPKASYSVASMAWGVTPRREAVGRSMTTVASSPLFWRSEFTSASWGRVRSRWSTRGAHSKSSRASSPWRVYWYWALAGRPPIRRSWTGCM